ncbi:hypothetical protein BXZ70DRAFT_948141 [Cristinia sonorae]|uniref:Uncharacterized protein n=1 Tax=Cristinia sonorae TaxID=1940300 RepID=A0A8K0UIW5_9AGAR|nr:hypothetical protein BXZ70DRAFT_948141 [Cristinia sonorae]
MLSSSRAPLARVAQGRMAARRVAGVRTCQRFQSTAAGSQPSMASHVAAGVAGGTIVILGGYSYYHFSGAKTAIDTAKATRTYFQQTTQSIKEKAPKNPNEVISFLRSMSKTYLSVIPGASAYIDTTFDTLDDLQESHGDELNKILTDTYNEVQAIVKDSETGADLDTARRLWEVLGKRVMELQELSKKAGGDAFAILEKKHPQVAQTIGSSYKNLKNLAESSGPEAKKLSDETSQQLKDIFAKGFSQESLQKAQELVKSKSSQVQELAQKASQKAWDASLSSSSSYLDKLPEIKSLLSDNASKFVSAGALSMGVASDEAKEVFDKVKEVGEEKNESKRKEKVKELKDFIIRKAEEAQSKGGKSVERAWESLQEWVQQVPGGSEALEKMPDMKVFVQLSQKKSEDAKKLAKETYDEVLKVLEAKAKKARGLVDEAKDEAKEKASS